MANQRQRHVVRWDPAERTQVARAAAGLWLERQGEPRWSELRALKQAQVLVLPAHRQRAKLQDRGTDHDLVELMLTYAARLAEPEPAAEPDPTPETAPVPAPVEETAPVVASAPVPEPEPEPRPVAPDVTPEPLRRLSDEIVALSSKLAAHIAAALYQQLATEVRAIHDAIPEAPPTAFDLATIAKPLRKVAIVGLFPIQVSEIKRDFDKCFDLRFIHVDENERQMPDRLRGAEHAFVMLGKVNHTTTQQVKRSGVPFTMVDGSVSRLRDVLTTYYCQT